jgi:hypothetical protein
VQNLLPWLLLGRQISHTVPVIGTLGASVEDRCGGAGGGGEGRSYSG